MMLMEEVLIKHNATQIVSMRNYSISSPLVFELIKTTAQSRGKRNSNQKGKDTYQHFNHDNEILMRYYPIFESVRLK